MFEIQTTDEWMVTFRKLLLIEQFKNPKLEAIYESEYTGKGIGSLCLKKLEDEAQKMNISHLVAEISSENNGSISFHKKHGYSLVGELHDIGEKFGREFGIVYMQKTL